jgi:hypothetical protein
MDLYYFFVREFLATESWVTPGKSNEIVVVSGLCLFIFLERFDPKLLLRQLVVVASLVVPNISPLFVLLTIESFHFAVGVGAPRWAATP